MPAAGTSSETATSAFKDNDEAAKARVDAILKGKDDPLAEDVKSLVALRDGQPGAANQKKVLK